ncbi:MAG: hypothetical protein RLZ14_1561 [Actinomycetota bacterium]
MTEHRHISARRRVNLAAVTGVATGLVVALAAPWQLALLTAWNAMAVALLVVIWRQIWGADAERTRLLSVAEDGSRRAAHAVMTAAAVVTPVGMAFGLSKAHHVGQPMASLLTVSAVAAVVLAWTVVHTLYAVHYAHLYYVEPVGGLDFHADELPDFRDFAYVAFTVGMSFAISDTDVQGRKLRRSVTGHALVSYLLGAVIVGLTINLIAAFIR